MALIELVEKQAGGDLVRKMLTQSVENALRVEGFDTQNIGNLSLGQIVEIKGVLESGMTATDRSKVERLLAGN